ncbi:hypothetical protein EG240_06050 [Paenimyroides tangerinum]|uniref:Uncharacterized protein n=1 Tax=Paenimyroides tangerinum TaxID=2488728 RepID=A0A3P3W8T5_9FLAO|nr:hypothetical protein [Paenimyroides tangerinum]RRJ91565.1 hypothetical protein EG240_06050 [Paenimyroides tangerinum]
MKKIVILFIFFYLNMYSQNGCYRIDKLDFSKIIFDKEKIVFLENQNTEDFGNILVKVYFFGETVIKIKSIKSDFNNSIIDYNDPIYTELYIKLIQFFEKNVTVQYEKNVIYSMTYIFKYYSIVDNTDELDSADLQSVF